MSETKSKDKRFDKIIVLMKKKFEQRKYYEGQQMLKTLYSRLLNQNKYEQASKLLSEGALTLMGHKKIKESVEITNDLINLWKKDPNNQTLTVSRSQLLHELFCMIPQTDKQSTNDFMRYVLEWITDLKKNNLRNRKLINEIDINMMAIYKSYGINLWNTKEYYKASSSFVRTSEISKMVDMFAEWSQKSSSKETPYYITRIVLQYLCVGNVNGCRQFIQSVCPVKLSLHSFYFYFIHCIINRETIYVEHHIDIHWKILVIYYVKVLKEKVLFYIMLLLKHMKH